MRGNERKLLENEGKDEKMREDKGKIKGNEGK